MGTNFYAARYQDDDPLPLGRPIEVNHLRYQCPVCGLKLGTISAPWTGWQEWCRTEDGRRHYKTRCNIMGDAMIMFRRMFCEPYPKEGRYCETKA